MEWTFDGEHTWFNEYFYISYEDWYCGLFQYVLYRTDTQQRVDQCEYLENLQNKAEIYKEAFFDESKSDKVI